jgi:hypothetical protein
MQDFAKNRKTYHFNEFDGDADDWSPDIPSISVGILIGIIVASVVMMIDFPKLNYSGSAEIKPDEALIAKPMKFEFYDALKTYEVFPN